MLTAAASLAAVLATTALASAAPDAAEPPSPNTPLVVSVTAAADIPRTLVTMTLREADAVWRAAGVRFIWERGSGYTLSALHVIIGGGASPVKSVLPLAWIAVGEDGLPTNNVYVSHANAISFMNNSRETVGLTDAMPTLQRHTYLARAMGRALAHEIGHFLLESRAHSEKGLMMASHSSSEFFSVERYAFGIGAAERRKVAARFASIYLASRG